MGWEEILLRLGAAAVIGSVVGLLIVGLLAIGGRVEMAVRNRFG
ncbi:MAG TPA: hypothetical protein VHX18_06830 [Rhizomicrobium sp.]|jgi:hypothetical protein|nr:hypothetical protein [Rhizomicrobium sp.]